MCKRIIFSLLLVLLAGAAALADGLLLPTAEDYPKDFLRNRLTRVHVKIHGIVSETIVYQEFINEWHDSTDAVYSFPLPPDARATQFLYWRNDTLFKAVLRVRQQAVNPGTGEGGIVAEVNEYIGRNGIKVKLLGIAPGTIQRVQLHYLSFCDYFRGDLSYRYPLKTGRFVTYPLESLQFTFEMDSNAKITGYEIPTHSDFRVVSADTGYVKLQLDVPKAYIDQDLVFRYQTSDTRLGVDFYSVANDTLDGHFALFVRPPAEADSAAVLPKRVFFLLSNSSRMFGYKLEQSVAAISQSLDLLQPIDEFNILVFNSYSSAWKSAPLPATVENVQAAKTFLAGITIASGTRIDYALEKALAQIPDADRNNVILIFTDGRSPLDPRTIAENNPHHAGIFPIGIGDDLDRARLEMTATLNYGFVTYFSERDNLREGMLRVFAKLNQPILQDVAMEFGRAQVYGTFPQTIPTTYAGSYLFMTGRYKIPGTSAFALAGKTTAGITAFDFRLNFSADKQHNKFAESIWAKEIIDALEREIEIYGEKPALKDSLIALSLRYNIRCRYTAYVADYQETLPTGVEPALAETAIMPRSYLLGIYPNPFNPSTTIRFYLAPEAASARVKLLKIYNALGQLVQVIDINHLRPGVHEITFRALNYQGRPLPSGMYFIRLIVGNTTSTMRVLLVK